MSTNMPTSTPSSHRAPLASLDQNPAQELQFAKNNKSNNTQSEKQPLVEPTTEPIAIANATEAVPLPLRSMIAAAHCEHEDPYVQAFRISQYLQSTSFYNEPNYKQYRRIEGAFTAPTKYQTCRPIYLDDKNNACVLFSAHRTKMPRKIERSTGKLWMYRSEMRTAMIASRAVWLAREKEGREYTDLRICHFSVSMNDISILKYYWTGDLYNAFLETKTCKPRCRIMSFRWTCPRGVAPIDWVRDLIEEEEEIIKEIRSAEKP